MVFGVGKVKLQEFGKEEIITQIRDKLREQNAIDYFAAVAAKLPVKEFTISDEKVKQMNEALEKDKKKLENDNDDSDKNSDKDKPVEPIPIVIFTKKCL